MRMWCLIFLTFVERLGLTGRKQHSSTARQTSWSVCFSCGISRNDVQLPMWMYVVRERLRKDTEGNMATQGLTAEP